MFTVLIRSFSINIQKNLLQIEISLILYYLKRVWFFFFNVSGAELCLSPRARLVVAAVAGWLSRGRGEGRHASAHLALREAKEKKTTEVGKRMAWEKKAQCPRQEMTQAEVGFARLDAESVSVCWVWPEHWEQASDSSQAFPCFRSVWFSPAPHSCHCSARLEEANTVFW